MTREIAGASDICTMCGKDVTYPHTVSVHFQIQELCDDCYDKLTEVPE